VPADRYADFASLRGDPSDGLPGVKGVGEKTARALIQRYGSIDELLADAASHPPRLRASLEDAANYLAAMEEVVPVRTSVEVTLQPSERDDAALDEFGERYRLTNPLRRLREAIDA
jgi:5'-3' exonuclease